MVALGLMIFPPRTVMFKTTAAQRSPTSPEVCSVADVVSCEIQHGVPHDELEYFAYVDVQVFLGGFPK